MQTYFVRVRLEVNDPVIYGVESLEQELDLFNKANSPGCQAFIEGWTKITPIDDQTALVESSIG